jgi:hypothetical protein
MKKEMAAKEAELKREEVRPVIELVNKLIEVLSFVQLRLFYF